MVTSQRAMEKWFWLTLSGLSSVILGYGCSGAGMNVGFDTGSSTASSTSTLTLGCTASTLAYGSTATCSTSGGVVPITFALISGQGSLNTTYGIYTAPSFDTTAQIQATDANGAKATSSITVLNTAASSLTRVKIYRFYQTYAGHFFTSSLTEGTSAGYTYEGNLFDLIAGTGASGTHIVYRCRTASGLPFMSLSSGCEGTSNIYEGIMGAMFDSYQTGTYLVNRYHWNDSNGLRDFISASADEGTSYLIPNGYVLDGALGYAYTP